MDRIKQRRRLELSGVLNYLQNTHDDYDQIRDLKDLFSRLRNNLIRKQIIKMTERIHSQSHDQNNEE